jgi:flavodoxin
MKVLIAYFSQTGNTEKVSRAIHDAVNVDADVVPIGHVKDVSEYDLIFCGFPVHIHSVPEKVQSFIKMLPQGKKLALFSTHGSMRANEKATTAIEHAVSLASKVVVLGTFSCRGEVNPKIIETLAKEPTNRPWCEEAQGALGHPDKADVADAEEFARKIVAKVR